MRRSFYFYILASDWRDLFVGVNNNVVGRIIEHRRAHDPYRRVFHQEGARLVHVEAAGEARDAMRREKQLKGWTRRRKVRLIERYNPTWEDLAAHWH